MEQHGMALAVAVDGHECGRSFISCAWRAGEHVRGGEMMIVAGCIGFIILILIHSPGLMIHTSPEREMARERARQPQLRG